MAIKIFPKKYDISVYFLHIHDAIFYPGGWKARFPESEILRFTVNGGGFFFSREAGKIEKAGRFETDPIHCIREKTRGH